jgi:quinohemoprotein ethanol dehydrogenase
VLEDASAPQPDPRGRLIAWDPINQKEAWGVDYQETWWNGGVLTTSGGLVFQGICDGSFIAYDGENGNKLWDINLGTGIMGSPISFEIDGVQYISVAVGWGAWAGKGYQFTEYTIPRHNLYLCPWERHRTS